MWPRLLFMSVATMAMLADPVPVWGQETFDLRVILELVRHDKVTVDAKTTVRECTQFLATKGYNDPLSPKVLEARVNAYLRLEMWSAAKDDAEELCKMRPKDPHIFRLRAKAYAGLGDVEQTAASGIEAARLEPSVAEERTFSALQMVGRGRLKEAHALVVDKVVVTEAKNVNVHLNSSFALI